jgi:hypothetical protein
MTDSPQLCVQRRLAEYLNDSAAEFRGVARQFNALPVYADLGGTLFITTSLQVLSMRSDDTAVVEEHSPQWRLVALVAAADRFPELKQLLPVRPSNVATCAVCLGTGRLEQGPRCGVCFGLGWPALHSNNSLEGDAWKPTRASGSALATMSRKKACRGLALFGTGMLCVIWWGAWREVVFAATADKITARIVASEVTREIFSSTGTLNVPGFDRTTLAPLVTIAFSERNELQETQCVVRGKLAVFGYQSPPQDGLRHALALLASSRPVDAFIRRQKGILDCKLSRAIDPGILVLSAFVFIITVASTVGYVRHERVVSER